MTGSDGSIAKINELTHKKRMIDRSFAVRICINCHYTSEYAAGFEPALRTASAAADSPQRFELVAVII
jgi:hypothetical protein